MDVAANLPIEVAATRDRDLVRSLISGDRWITAHALCDLDDGEFPRTRCYIARRGPEHIALGMEYSGWAPQPLHLYGEPAGIAAILMHGIKPRAAWVPTPIGGDPVLDLHYVTEKINPMLRMGVDKASFTPFLGEAATLVAPLVPADAPALNRLYQLGFAAWLPPLAVAEGLYRGIHRNGRLVAAAGTHVVGRRERIAVVDRGRAGLHVEVVIDAAIDAGDEPQHIVGAVDVDEQRIAHRHRSLEQCCHLPEAGEHERQLRVLTRKLMLLAAHRQGVSTEQQHGEVNILCPLAELSVREAV